MALKILFVDDDIDDRAFFRDALSYVDPAIACDFAKNGREAIEKVAVERAPYDFVFLDIHMPLLSGKECLMKLRDDERYSNKKVIMYSTSSDEALMREYKSLGATYFLIKPDTFEGLCNSLAVLFDKT